MSEGRRTSVVLGEGSVVEVVVQPRLEVAELLSLVASHVGLRDPDKALFGLAFQDESLRLHWLQPDRRVLEHEFPRKLSSPSAPLVLQHLPKFFPDTVAGLRHAASLRLFFLHARAAIATGDVQVAHEDVPRLAALLLQMALGDCSSEEATSVAEASAALPLSASQRSAAPALVADAQQEALTLYRHLNGTQPGDAMLQYMGIVEGCVSWGMNFYEVRDKSQTSWVLGVSSKGIFQFPATGPRLKPRRVFQWKSLENIYYRDKKFSIEVHDPRRVVHQLSGSNLYEEALTEEPDDLTAAIGQPTTQVSVSRRSFAAASVQVFVFYCATAAQCKTVWQSSIAQHQFYLDRKPLAHRLPRQHHGSRSNLPQDAKRNAMAQALTSLLSRGSGESLLKTTSASVPSLASSGDSGTGSTEKSEEERVKERELYKALKAKKTALEHAMRLKLRELKHACIQEAAITGEMPPEVRRTLLPGEKEPRAQRRVGTGWTMSSELLESRSLRTDVEVQRKIAEAAQRLAQDKSTNKSVRKKRQRDAHAAAAKLKEMEGRMASGRLSASKPDLSSAASAAGPSKAWPNHKGAPALSCPTTPRGSLPDLAQDTVDRSAAEELDLDEVPLPIRRPSYDSAAGRPPRPPADHRDRLAVFAKENSSPSLPASPLKSLPSGSSLDSASLPVYENIGYKNSIYQSSYRKKQYPTLAPKEAGGVGGAAGRRLTQLHRTHSEHSLASLPASEMDSIQPLPDFRTGGSQAVDHNLGAYNIPHQRTSWNLACVPPSLATAGDSSDSLCTDSLASSTSSMRYGFGRNVSELARKLVPPANGLGSAGQSGSSLGSPSHPPSAHLHGLHPSGSLDRRLLRARGPLRNKVSGSDLRSSAQPAGLPPSPAKRVPIPPSSTLRTSASELVKPYETSDVLKYSQRRSPAASPASSPSPRLGPRPPPPPYGRSPGSPGTMSPTATRLPSAALRAEMATWYDAQGKPKQKTATIV